MVTEKEFAKLIQDAAKGTITPAQASAIAAKTAIEMRSTPTGTSTRQGFQKILQNNISLITGKSSPLIIEKIITKEKIVTKEPRRVYENLIDPKERERQEILEQTIKTLTDLFESTNIYRSFSWVTPPTIEELKDSIGTAGETEARNGLNYWDPVLQQMKNFEKFLRAHLERIYGIPLNYGPNLEWQKLMTERINEEIKTIIESRKPLISKAIPYVQEIVDVYQERLSQIELEKPKNEEIVKLKKQAQDLVKRASKIVKEFEKLVPQFVVKPEDSKLIDKALLLKAAWDSINGQFVEIKCKLAPFGIDLGITLPEIAHIPKPLQKILSTGD